MISFLNRLIRKDDGATAIEFSLLMMPYVLISLAIIEMSLMFMSASLLEGASDSASRLLRTGQIQQSNSDPEEMFRNALCEYAVVLIDCSEMVVEVVKLDSYSDYTAVVYDVDGNMISSGFDAGGSNDKLLVRVAYRYEMITPIVGRLLNGDDGGTLFVSTIVLQTEPYEFQGA